MEEVVSAQAGVAWYVSPSGDDANPGTVDRPYATLARARDVVREQRARGVDGPITVYLRGGIFRLTESFVLTPDDSGAIYRAYPGETPVLSSAIPLTGWRKLSSQPDGLPTAARDHVWVTSLPEVCAGRRVYTLYDGMTRLPRARSAGFTPTSEPAEGVRDTLHFPPGALARWDNLDDVEILIRPSYPWVLNILPLRDVDVEAGVARTALPGTYPLGPLSPHARTNVGPSCWVENVLEALDSPGAWVLDSKRNLLYLWPLGDTPGDEIAAPCLTELVRLEGDEATGRFVHDVVLQGITFAHADREAWTAEAAGLQHDWELYDTANALVRFRGVERCRVEGCRFTASGGSGLRLDLHCQGNVIVDNEFCDLGGTGVLLCGYGPGTRDVHRDNHVMNNHLHHCGRIFWHASAIFVWQSGANSIAHNLIHHMPYNGITVSGVRPGHYLNRANRECARTIRWDEVGDMSDWDAIMPFLHARNNVVEHNEIHHVVETLEDGNGIYLSGAGEGNLVRGNYLHDLLEPGCQAALRTDDFQRGTVITHNIIAHCVYGGIILKHANTIENNIIAGLVERERVPLQGYIMLRRGPVQGAMIRRNILYQRGVTGLFYEEGKWGIPPGLLADCLLDANILYAVDAPELAAETLRELQERGLERHSLAVDPLFIDADNGDFRLQQDSPALRIGIVPIDVRQAGIIDASERGQYDSHVAV